MKCYEVAGQEYHFRRKKEGTDFSIPSLRYWCSCTSLFLLIQPQKTDPCQRRKAGTRNHQEDRQMLRRHFQRDRIHNRIHHIHIFP